MLPNGEMFRNFGFSNENNVETINEIDNCMN